MITSIYKKIPINNKLNEQLYSIRKKYKKNYMHINDFLNHKIQQVNNQYY